MANNNIRAIEKEFPLETISKIFNGDQFYIKLFKNLLKAAVNNDFTIISRTQNEIKNLYLTIHNKVEEFVMREIYENIYSSTAYDGLISALIDIYAVMYTCIHLRAHITDITIQPDDIVDAYLDMFGFKCKDLFNYIQRREICKVVYWYLRRKGTPALIVKLLNMLGFNYFYICEFEILEFKEVRSNEEEEDDFTTIFSDFETYHVYHGTLLYEQKPNRTALGFFNEETYYTYDSVKNYDPLAIINDNEISENINMSFPAQSPYYQVGVAVTYTELERIVSAFTYAMMRKTYYNMDIGENVFDCRVTNYENNVSFISLILGYTYILASYFGVHDTELYELYTIKEAYDIPIRYDVGPVPSRWKAFEGNPLPEFPEYDGGFATDEFDKILDGGNCGLVFTDINGGNATTDSYNDEYNHEEPFTIDIDGDDATDYPLPKLEYDGEEDGGFADSFKLIDNRLDIFYLRNGFTYAKYDFGELSRREIGDIKVPNTRNVYDRDVDPVLYDKDGNLYDKETAARNNTSNDDPRLYKLKYPVFGWQKPIAEVTPAEIMIDIDTEIKRLMGMLSWNPSQPEIRLVDKNNTIYKERDTIKTRKENRLAEIYNIFYGKPIYGSYKHAYNEFIRHDNNFKEYIDSILLTPEERIQLAIDGKWDDIYDNFDNVLTLLDNILEAVEYFIFDNTAYIIPVRNLMLSYSKILEIIKRLDEFYTPYHAELLFPLIVWIIRDLPGDQVAIDDTDLITISPGFKMQDVVWRADHYNMYDINPPDPYGPIEDWQCDNPNMPHIPISLNYLDEPYYDREYLQKVNRILYSIGYDWRYLDEEGLIVRSECLRPIWDWDPDLIQTHGECLVTSGFDVIRPDKDRLALVEQMQNDVQERLRFIDLFTCNITGDNKHRIYNLNHQLNSKDIFVTVYDLKDGFDIECHVVRRNNNEALITFKNPIPVGQSYRIIITAPVPKETENFERKLTGGLYNIVGNGKMKHFLFIHNRHTDDSFIEVYDKFSGENVGCAVRRFNRNQSIVSFNLPPDNTRKYRVNVASVFDYQNKGKVHPQETMFMSFNVKLENERSIKIDHKFYTNNLITRVYDIDTDEDVDVLITHHNTHQMSLDFHETVSFGNYRIIMMGMINTHYDIAVPLNNITGFSGAFFGDSRSVTYNIQHNLNSENTFEQVIDADTGEIIRVLVNRVDKNNIEITFGQPPNSNRDFIVNVFAPMNTHTLAYPSTCFNTALKQFTIESVYAALDEYNGLFAGTTNNEYEGELDGGKNIEKDNVYNAGQATTENTDIEFNATNGLFADLNLEVLNNNNHNISYSFTLDCGDAYVTALLPTEFSKMRISGGYAHTDDYYYRKVPTIITDFVIKHDIHNKNVTVQVYNQDMLKVEVLTKIIDEDRILISFRNPVLREETYYVNILSLPDTSVPITNFNKLNYNLMFIDMYHESLPIKEFHKSRKILDFDGGFATTPDEEFEFQFEGGYATNIEAHFRNIMDGGWAYTAHYIGYTTFSINHKLNTKTVMVSVFDENTKETVDTFVAINDENWVTVGFKNPPKITDKYHVVVIGALPADNIFDIGFDVDTIRFRPPHHYREMRTRMFDYKSIHQSTDRDFWDQPPELVTDGERDYLKYNVQKFDLPVIMERVDIIHEIVTETGELIFYDHTEDFGFNEFDVITNDPYCGKEADTGFSLNTLETYTKGLFID